MSINHYLLGSNNSSIPKSFYDFKAKILLISTKISELTCEEIN